MENPNFLKEKYNLHTAPEVETAARRTEVRSGEKVPKNPADRIQNYLDRLEKLALDPEKKQARKMLAGESRPRALGILREMVMAKYVRPNKQKMAEGAARVEERAAREMGIEAHYGEQELERRGEIAVADLEKSLDNWISYLSDMNEPYPVWFRYYAFRNVLNLGDYDKDKGEFTERSKGSTRLFPDVDRGALAYVEQMIEAGKDPEMLERLQNAQVAAGTPADQLITKKKAEAFAKFSFAKQYVEGIKQAGEITSEMREETGGKWVKYGKGTEPTALWSSLQNKGTAWCTKGFATAETQLQGGDFYVYYTYDKQGKPTIPRIAIRMQGDSIGEVRGVADNDQNLEGNMTEIAEAKMNELPGADRYRKASADMKLLTQIENKTRLNQSLTKDDLAFLYEIDSPIEGFGYQRDPRIEELRKQRNPETDASVVFECSPGQIAHNAEEINENTKAYVGKLESGIFDQIQKYGIEHIYTKFPEGKIQRYNIEIGGKAKDQLKKEMKAKNIYVSDYADDLLEKIETLKQAESTGLIRITVKDLGFPGGATTDQVYKRAKELGLELCPAETGPHLRLQYSGKEWILVAIKQMAGRGGRPGVFGLSWVGDRLELRGGAGSGHRWSPGSKFVFRLRKLET